MSGLFLVTGGAGFIGSNLTHRLASEGQRVRVLDALARPGVDRNLEWLRANHGQLIEPIVGDVRDASLVREAMEGAQGAFHFAAQVAVTTSMADPADDLSININGTFNVLEASRAQPEPVPVIFASTNKVYGDLADFGTRLGERGYEPANRALAQHGVGEAQPLDFHTPYGCSKGAADQYVVDYSRSFGVPTCVLRMSCIYGERQMGTEDQGWVAHFLIRALEGKPITIYGDGDQVRDVLYVGDAVDAYLAAWAAIDRITGRAFNVGGGPSNAISLNTLISHISTLLERKTAVETSEWRPGDQRWFVADTRAIDTELDLPAKLDWRLGIERLLRWLSDERGQPEAKPVPVRAVR